MMPHMPSELQLHPVKLKHKPEHKSHYMYDMLCRDHVISAITWLKQHNGHYKDITLNEHWYSDITSRQLSLQLDESDNHITVNEDAVLNQSLRNEKINKETPNTGDNQELCTTQIDSTNTDTIDTETDEDTELAEEQIAINHRQELTGDHLPSVNPATLKSTVMRSTLVNPPEPLQRGSKNIRRHPPQSLTTETSVVTKSPLTTSI